MDIKQEYEQELTFQVEPENKKNNKDNKSKAIMKLASKNLKKIMMLRLSNKIGEC